MDEQLKKYWENLDVPVSDFIEEISKDGDRFRLKAFHRISHDKALDWCSYISQTNLSTKEEQFGLLQAMSDEEVLRIYCSLEFSSKIPLSIIRRISSRQGINPNQVHRSILIDKLRLVNNELLEEVFIEHLIERRHFKTYSAPIISSTISDMPSKGTMSRWLTNFESTRKVKNARQIHVWWAREREGWWLYLFRIEQKRSKPVRKVDRNIYEKVAGTKILLIKPDFSTVKLYTGGEEKTMKRRFTYVLQKIMKNPSLKYDKFVLIYPKEVIASFVRKIILGEYKSLRLCSIRYNTSRFAGSPALGFSETASNGLERTLVELEQMNKLPEDRACTSLALARDLEEFDLTFRGTENRVEIILGRRGLMPSIRDKILLDLNEKLLAIQNETRT